MKKICKLVLILVLFANTRAEPEICAETSLELTKAFVWNNHLVVFTSQKNVYIIEDILWNGTDFNVNGSIEKMQNWTTLAEDMKLAFTMNYSTDGMSVITINLEKRENIEQLVGYIIQFDANVKQVIFAKNLTINIYKAKPNEDPLNLKTLFFKFPNEDLESHMKAIVSFPDNEPSLPKRFFVYYLETPPKGKVNNCSQNCSHFKRYTLIEEMTQYDTTIEMDWRFVNQSDRCVELTDSVDAAFALTNYTFDGNQYNFDLIEFFGTEYSVNRVPVTKDQVFANFQNVKNGSIRSLFGCQETTLSTLSSTLGPDLSSSTGHITPTSTLEPEPVTNSNSFDVEPTQETDNLLELKFWFISIVIILFSIIIIIIFMTFFVFTNGSKPNKMKISLKQKPSKNISISPPLKSADSEEQKSSKSDIGISRSESIRSNSSLT